MTYRRVIPRDLFNEANLLKCLGQLYLKLEPGGHNAVLHHARPNEDFGVTQSDADGSISVRNVVLFVRDEIVLLHRPLNSREPYPLYATTPEDEEIAVFNDFGDLTDSFLAFIT
jgi:hypothetical protein